MIFVSAGLFAPNAAAQSLPTGGTVTVGQATIQSPAASQLLIEQSSATAIIAWDGFSIGAGNAVQFNNGSGATLNRVTGSQITQINGSLSATGSLFVINQNGIVIGANGIVATGGSFVASTLDIADSDFLDGGNNIFSGNSTASVINYGRISSLGGDVALISHLVTNEGEITAPNGTAGLIAGQEILMRDAAVGDGLFEVRIGGPDTSVTNSGRISAAAVELRANGGNVYALAGNSGGNIQATGSATQGGRVFLTAPGGRVVSSSRVRARRRVQAPVLREDGGEVYINADFVSIGGVIDVDGYNGGKVMIDAGLLSLAEPVTARGTNGAGGTIKITATGDVLAPSTSLLDVSGATDGGSIRFVGLRDMILSGNYLATGTTGQGGTIDISGGATRLLSAAIDASGFTGGGQIRIGGEFQGGKGLLIDELPNAQRLAATDATTIRVDATGADGEGGRIILWADERAAVLATISARPGTQSGVGGFVEVSSAGELIYRAEVETSVGERKGTVLLDPKTFTVADLATFNQSIFILGSGFSFPDVATNLDNSDFFGSAVSLDGNRLAVGAHADDSANNGISNTGAVYLFSFIDSVFNGGVLEAIIGSGYVGGKNVNVAALESTDGFGRAVSLDGNRLAVGSPLEDGAGNATSQSGAVYLFSFTDNAFNGGLLEATVGRGYVGGKNIDVAALSISDQFGMGVSLDGNRLAIGARRDDAAANNTNDTGAVYLFSFTDSVFSGGMLEAIVGSGYAGPKDINVAVLDNLDLFGTSVSLDGNRLAVGAVGDDGLGNASGGSGAVYLFSFVDAAFNGGALQAVLGKGIVGGLNIDVASLEVGDRFGLGVSLDGNRLAVGAVNDDGAGNMSTDSGAVYLFSFADAAFNGGALEATIGRGYTGGKNIDVVSLENSDEFGASVSLNSNRLAAGARFEDGVGNVSAEAGAVYLFSFTDAAFNGGQLEAVIGEGYGALGGKNIDLAANLDDGDNFGRFVSLDGNRIAIGALFDDGFGNSGNNTGAVYLFTFTDANFAGGALAGIIGEGYVGGRNIDLSVSLDNGDEFGRAVSLDGTRLAVGAIGDDGAGNASPEAGAIYLFTFADPAFLNGALSARVGDGYAGPNDIDLSGFLDTTDSFAQFASLDGNRLAIGAPADDGPGVSGAVNTGAVYLFTFADAAFAGGSLQAILGAGYNGRPKDIDLSAQIGVDDIFGGGVSLDGARLAVGVPNDDGGGFNTGAVFLFTFTDTAFSGGTLVATIGEGFTGPKDINIAANLDPVDLFGADVSLDGNRLAVGSPGDDGFGLSGTGNFTGSVYLFSFTDAVFSGGTLEGIIGEGYTGGKNVDLSTSLDPNDTFAASLSLDGNRLAVGSFGDDGLGNTTTDTGAVYLFSFTDTAFNGAQLEAIIGAGYVSPGGKNIDLSANLDDGDNFGRAVSLDGNRLAVGALFDDGFGNSGNNTGAVYLFTFTDANFAGGALASIIGEGYVGGKNVDLSANLDNFDEFGRSVSLDGTRLAVGARGDDGFGNASPEAGAVYLFTFSDATFSGGTLTAMIGDGYNGPKDINLTGFLDVNDDFSQFISLDGTRLAVGAPADDGPGTAGVVNTGAVYLFTFADTAFTGGSLQAVFGAGYNARPKDLDLSAQIGVGDIFGSGVSLDGTRLAVGIPNDDGGGFNTGAVFLFTFTDQEFTGGTLVATIGEGFVGPNDINIAANLDPNDQFGGDVSLDGNRLAVGSPGDDGFGLSGINNFTGAAYLFSFTDAVFSGGTLEAIIGKGYTGGKNLDLSNSLDNNDTFSASLSLDGRRLAVGSFGDDGQGNTTTDTGAAYLFTDVFGTGDPVTDAVFATGVGDNITITPAALKALLDAGNNVILQANSDGIIKNAILVDNPGGNGGNLTLQVGRSLLIEASIATDGGNLTLIANETLANGVVDGDRDPGNGVITINPGVTFNLGAGVFLLDLRNGAGKTNSGAGDVTFGAGSSVTAGRIQILNNGAEASNQVIFNAGTLLTASGGGDAIVISADVFNNNASAGLFSFLGGGRFLVYSNTFTGGNFNAGGLAGGNLYNRNIAANPAGSIGQAGSQFIFNFQPVLLVTANNATRQYGLANPAFSAAIAGLVNGDVLGGAVAGNAALASAGGFGTNVGGVPIIASLGSLLSDIGYAFAFAPGTQTITPASLTITANDLIRIEGQANPAFTASFGGFRNGDTSGVFTSQLVFNTVAGVGSAPGNFAVLPSGAAAQNYIITFVPGTLLVAAAPAGTNGPVETGQSAGGGSGFGFGAGGFGNPGGGFTAGLGGNGSGAETGTGGANQSNNGGGNANGAGAGNDGDITGTISGDSSDNADGDNDGNGSANATGGNDGGAGDNATEENVEEAEVTDPDYPDFAFICRENIGEIAGFCQLF